MLFLCPTPPSLTYNPPSAWLSPSGLGINASTMPGPGHLAHSRQQLSLMSPYGAHSALLPQRRVSFPILPMNSILSSYNTRGTALSTLHTLTQFTFSRFQNYSPILLEIKVHTRFQLVAQGHAADERQKQETHWGLGLQSPLSPPRLPCLCPRSRPNRSDLLPTTL